jgi:hypothetical protein
MEADMATTPKEQNPSSEKSEENVDKTVEENFPRKRPARYRWNNTD